MRNISFSLTVLISVIFAYTSCTSNIATINSDDFQSLEAKIESIIDTSNLLDQPKRELVCIDEGCITVCDENDKLRVININSMQEQSLFAKEDKFLAWDINIAENGFQIHSAPERKLYLIKKMHPQLFELSEVFQLKGLYMHLSKYEDSYYVMPFIGNDRIQILDTCEEVIKAIPFPHKYSKSLGARPDNNHFQCHFKQDHISGTIVTVGLDEPLLDIYSKTGDLIIQADISPECIAKAVSLSISNELILIAGSSDGSNSISTLLFFDISGNPLYRICLPNACTRGCYDWQTNKYIGIDSNDEMIVYEFERDLN